MLRGLKFGTALATGLVLLDGGAAIAGSTVASWVQIGPGSSAAALGAGSYGDQPLSLVNTVLVRAVVTDATACPVGTYDDGSTLTLKQRFIASTLTNTPGTPGATNANANGYPQYFVAASSTQAGNLADGTPMATTSWGECEAVVSGTHKTVSVSGTVMKLPVAKPKRILVMADTGCRVNGALAANGANQQNCHSPAAFPLQYLTQFEASFNPDVILQVGDWFYRDTSCQGASWCTTNQTNPAYETWGDTFDSWDADVFFPMKTILGTAPWIMARGNHESCGRGARGWYALLDAFPYNFNNVICAKTGTYPSPVGASASYTADFEPSYIVPVNGVNFIVHDSSFANDSAVNKPTAQNYDIDLTNVINTLAAASPGSPAIFATHKPTFGLSFGSAPAGCAAALSPVTDNSGDFTEQGVFNGGSGYTGGGFTSAFLNGVPSNVALFVSGHVHQFQFFNFTSTSGANVQFPPQLVVGTGGSLLDADCGSTDFGNVPTGTLDVSKFKQTGAAFTVNASAGAAALPAQASNTFSHDEFGFALFDAITSGGVVTGYTADIYKISSARAGFCKINFNPRKISCNL
jgi:hypothetical protein